VPTALRLLQASACLAVMANAIASDLGPGATCPYDYCNCGGTIAPLLPTTLAGTPTVGYNAYSTVPTASSCSSGPASVPSPPSPSSSAGGGGAQSQLQTSVITGGLISTLINAFDTVAPLVTTFSYNGGALTYPKKTFTDQITVTVPTTISTIVTQTAPGGSLSTYTGHIVVDGGGIWRGPPGTAPNCIWPFCTLSDGGRGGGGGGGGPPPPPPPSPDGGPSPPSSPPSPLPAPPSGGGGSGGETGGEGSNDQPAPEACPGAGAKARRSSVYSISDSHLAKRTEKDQFSTNPLEDTFNALSTDKSGNSLADRALDGTEFILNRFPKDKPNAFVTGLTGQYKLPNKLKVGTGDNQQTFPANQNLFWRVRWDFDLIKGPHANAQFGTKPSSTFAFKLDPSKFTNGDTTGGKTMNQIAVDMNSKAQYSYNDNAGKSEPNFDMAGSKQKAMGNVKNAWKAIVDGPCT